jgi:hypothetical protein
MHEAAEALLQTIVVNGETKNGNACGVFLAAGKGFGRNFTGGFGLLVSNAELFGVSLPACNIPLPAAVYIKDAQQLYTPVYSGDSSAADVQTCQHLALMPVYVPYMVHPHDAAHVVLRQLHTHIQYVCHELPRRAETSSPCTL